MLSTLVRPTAGQARVAGHDVVLEPVEVRRAIGLVFQESALDRTLSVAENLRFAGALCGLSRRQIDERMDELLGLFDLASQRGRPVGALSGGMRRAVDIARGVLHRPGILFLDEPTIGLDVINRRAIWRFLDRLRHEQGTTLVLTTHYLEEAEGCEYAYFMQGGRIIGAGTPRALIAALGAYILEIETEDPDGHAARLTSRLGPALVEGSRLQFRIPDEDFPLAELQRELAREVRALHIKRPDLNDVYVWTNRRDAGQPASARGGPP
jgi:ABC-2 type transport system ATP-binding protein